MIDIDSRSVDPRASRLSNFTKRQFSLDDVQCASLEGVLQAIKTKLPDLQKSICTLGGKDAKVVGSTLITRDGWLYWADDPFPRFGKEYGDFLIRLYDTAYEQDPTFREDLLATGNEELRHSMGKYDQHETVLTETEFLVQLYRLRARANREPAPQMDLPGIR